MSDLISKCSHEYGIYNSFQDQFPPGFLFYFFGYVYFSDCVPLCCPKDWVTGLPFND